MRTRRGCVLVMVSVALLACNPAGGGAAGGGGEATGGGGAGGSAGGGGEATGGGGAGGGSVSTCEPGDVEQCYSGPPGTLGVGPCKPGYRVCAANGEGYGPCEGEITPVPDVCATPEDEDCDAATKCPGQHIFSKIFGAGVTDVRDVAADSQGNILVLGHSNGPINLGGGVAPGNALYVAKLGPLGSHLWTKRFNGYFGTAGAITADASNNVILTVTVADTFDFGGGPLPGVNSVHDIAVVKLDAAGTHLMSKRFATGKDVGSYRSRVAVDAAGNIVLAGSFTGVIDFGGGPLTATPTGSPDEYHATAFIAKLGPLGAHAWSHRYGEDFAGVSDVAIADGSGVLMSGNFKTKIDFGGGSISGPGGIDSRDYLVKLDAAGNHVFSKSFLSFGHGRVVVGPPNAFIYAGEGGDEDVDFGGGPIDTRFGFAVKFDGSAGHIWSRTLHTGSGSSGADLRDVAADPLGGVSFVGELQFSFDPGGGPIAGTHDAFVVKVGPAGEFVWGKGFGDSEQQIASSVAVDAAGSVIIVGTTNGAVDFGGGLLVNDGFTDGFIAKFAP